MATETIICRQCGKPAEKRKAELDRWRRKGRDYFFCGYSCAAAWAAEKTRAPEIEKVCPVCGKTFTTKRTCKEATFCSRSCASRGSVTPYRRRRAREVFAENRTETSPELMAYILRRREWPKYERLHGVLKKRGIKHRFEYPLADTWRIFDLAIPEKKLLIEFDGEYHACFSQMQDDQDKDNTAQKHGWRVIRMGEPIDIQAVLEVVA